MSKQCAWIVALKCKMLFKKYVVLFVLFVLHHVFLSERIKMMMMKCWRYLFRLNITPAFTVYVVNCWKVYNIVWQQFSVTVLTLFPIDQYQTFWHSFTKILQYYWCYLFRTVDHRNIFLTSFNSFTDVNPHMKYLRFIKLFNTNDIETV